MKIVKRKIGYDEYEYSLPYETMKRIKYVLWFAAAYIVGMIIGLVRDKNDNSK